jgi:hypothetical protein
MAVAVVAHHRDQHLLILDQVILVDQEAGEVPMEVQENQEDQEPQVKEMLGVVEQLTKTGMLLAAVAAAQVEQAVIQLLVMELQIQV